MVERDVWEMFLRGQRDALLAIAKQYEVSGFPNSAVTYRGAAVLYEREIAFITTLYAASSETQVPTHVLLDSGIEVPIQKFANTVRQAHAGAAMALHGLAVQGDGDPNKCVMCGADITQGLFHTCVVGPTPDVPG